MNLSLTKIRLLVHVILHADWIPFIRLTPSTSLETSDFDQNVEELWEVWFKVSKPSALVSSGLFSFVVVYAKFCFHQIKKQIDLQKTQSLDCKRIIAYFSLYRVFSLSPLDGSSPGLIEIFLSAYIEHTSHNNLVSYIIRRAIQCHWHSF